MKSKIQDLIQSCNDCILSCEAALKSCHSCIESCDNACSKNLAEDCSVDCQKMVEVCRQCMHACNQALANKLYETPKQEAALKGCINACKDSAKRCQDTISKIVDNESLSGCEWSLDSLNKCMSACDECIESFGE